MHQPAFERIKAQLRQVLREKRMREGEGQTTDETLLASQILAFAKVPMRSRSSAARSNTARRMILTPAGR